MSCFESPTSCDSLQYPNYLYVTGEFPTFRIHFQWIKSFSFLFLSVSHNTESDVLVRVLQGNRPNKRYVSLIVCVYIHIKREIYFEEFCLIWSRRLISPNSAR